MSGGQQAQTIGGCICLSFENPWNVIVSVSFNLLAQVKLLNNQVLLAH